MSAPLDFASIRADFPVLEQQVRGKPLVFLDSAASAQKPRLVIEAVSDFYSAHYASVHRGLYQLSAEATRSYEAVREKVQHFIGCCRRSGWCTSRKGRVHRRWGSGRTRRRSSWEPPGGWPRWPDPWRWSCRRFLPR